MEPDADMNNCEEAGLQYVDDLTVVAEIAEAELRQLERIQAAGAGARELRKRLESQQANAGAANGAQSPGRQDDGGSVVKEEGDAGGNDMEVSSEEEPDSADEAGQDGNSAPESDSRGNIEKLEDVLKLMQAKQVEPESPPPGPLHGLELTELAAEQMDVKINDTDKLTHIGRVSSVVDGIIVVKGLENSPPMDSGTVFCGEDRAVLGLVEDVFGQVTQPNYAVRPCGSSCPEVGTKIMAVTSLIVRVDLGTAANTPAIDFEEGVEDPEDLDNDDLDENGTKKATAGAASKVKTERKSSKAAQQNGQHKKPAAAVFQGVGGVDNAEDALKAFEPGGGGSGGRDGGGHGHGRGRGRGREGGGKGPRGRGRGGAGGRHSGGRIPEGAMAGPGSAASGAHRPQMQWPPSGMPGAMPVMFTAAGPAGPPGAVMGAMRPPPSAQAMHAMAGMQPGMPLMVIPQGYMHAGGAMVAAPMGGGFAAPMPPQMHMRPPVAGVRPMFAPHPPMGPPRGPMAAPAAAESFEQKLARALGPPPG